MGQKYRVVCLAITDKFGNMHRNQNVTRDAQGKIHVEDVILDAEIFEPLQLKNYLQGGHVEPYFEPEKEENSEEVVQASDQKSERETLKQKYIKLSGKNKVPGTWGAKKLAEEIELLKEKKND